MVRFWRGALAGCSISHPLLRWPLVRMRHRVGNVLQGQGYCESIRASPHNPLACDRAKVGWGKHDRYLIGEGKSQHEVGLELHSLRPPLSTRGPLAAHRLVPSWM